MNRVAYTTCTLRPPATAALSLIADRIRAVGIKSPTPNRGQLVELAVLTLLAEWDRGEGTGLFQATKPIATFPILAWAQAAREEYARDGIVGLSLAPHNMPDGADNLHASDHVFARIRGNLAERVAS